MNADGSLYARRVWYAASVDTLPRFSPEGLVRRVGDNWAGLYWDEAAGGWALENLVLAPEKLRDPTRITTGYLASTGSMGVTTYCWWDEALSQEMTVFLDTTGDLQTVVSSVVYNTITRVHTVTVPVPPAEWPALLTPTLPRVRVWLRPVKGSDGTFTWRAYTVIAYQAIL